MLYAIVQPVCENTGRFAVFLIEAGPRISVHSYARQHRIHWHLPIFVLFCNGIPDHIMFAAIYTVAT